MVSNTHSPVFRQLQYRILRYTRLPKLGPAMAVLRSPGIFPLRKLLRALSTCRWAIKTAKYSFSACFIFQIIQKTIPIYTST